MCRFFYRNKNVHGLNYLGLSAPEHSFGFYKKGLAAKIPHFLDTSEKGLHP